MTRQNVSARGVSIRLISLEDEYDRVADRAIILNDPKNGLDASTREEVNRLIYSHYSTDVLDSRPMCDGAQSGIGEFHLVGERYRGEICPTCGTVCDTVTEASLDSILWVEANIEGAAFITPAALATISRAFVTGNSKSYDASSAKECPLSWFLDKGVRVNKALHDRLKAIGIPRGLVSFHKNFDAIIEGLVAADIGSGDKPGWTNYKGKYGVTLEFIRKNRDKIFSSKLAIPNRQLFIVEKTSASTFTDSNLHDIVNTIRTALSLAKEEKVSKIERRLGYINRALTAYMYNYISNSVGRKGGIARGRVFGARMDYTGRAVVISRHNIHDMRSARLPWAMLVKMYKNDLYGKISHNYPEYNSKQIDEIIDFSIDCPVDNDWRKAIVIESIDQLIKESVTIQTPGLPEIQGLPILLQRNPSLTPGSAQLFYVDGFKTDPLDNTIEISDMCLVALNCDFDGDELNVSRVIDMVELELMQELSPIYRVMDIRNPETVSSNIKFQAPMIETAIGFIEEFPEVEEYARKLAAGEINGD